MVQASKGSLELLKKIQPFFEVGYHKRESFLQCYLERQQE
jgi:hypothetical protein